MTQYTKGDVLRQLARRLLKQKGRKEERGDNMEEVKPKVKFTGENENIFHLLAICKRAYREARNEALVEGKQELADKYKRLSGRLTNEVFASRSYDEALAIMRRHCDVS